MLNFWFKEGGGELQHPSTVLYGTLSFDVFLVSFHGTTHEVRFTEGVVNYQLNEVKNSPNTQISISTQKDPNGPNSSSANLGEQLTGWQHIDITKDESGLTKVYLNGEFVVEHFDDQSFDAESVVVYTCCEGSAFDNIVVRNQIIDIQP